MCRPESTDRNKFSAPNKANARDAEQLIEPWTSVRTLHHVYLTPRVPYTTCTRLPSTCPWLYLTRLHQSSPSHVTVYSTFDQVILHVATLHHTTFSPHIRSIITSAFGRNTYQISTSLYSSEILARSPTRAHFMLHRHGDLAT
jgi:hypothetical protein